MQQKHTDQKGRLKFLAVVIIGIFFIASAAAYLVTDGFKRNTHEQANVTEEKSSDVVGPMVINAESIQLVQKTLEGGEPVVCNFQYKTQTGTAHINSDSQFRIDVDTDKGLVHVIRRDSNAYLWTKGQPNGIVFSNQEQDAFERNFGSIDPLTLERQTQDNSISSLDCKNQPFEKDLLTLPEDVNFQSYTDLTNVRSENQNNDITNEKLTKVRDMVAEKWAVLSEFKNMTIPSDRSTKKLRDNQTIQKETNSVKPQ